MNNTLSFAGAARGVSAGVLAFSLAAGSGTALAADQPHLELDKCYPTATAAALLKEDNQDPIAKITTLDGANTARVHYSNKTGSLGYDLRSDLPVGTPPTQLCVKAVLTNIQIHSTEQSAPPSFLKVRDGDGVKTTNFTKAYDKGDRVVMSADSLVTSQGKMYLSNKLATLVSPQGVGTFEDIDARSGLSTNRYGIKSFALTQFGQALFERQSAAAVASTKIAQATTPVIQQPAEWALPRAVVR